MGGAGLCLLMAGVTAQTATELTRKVRREGGKEIDEKFDIKLVRHPLNRSAPLSATLNLTLQIKSDGGERQARSSTPYNDYLRWLKLSWRSYFTSLINSSKAEELGLSSCPGEVRRDPPALTAPSLLSRAGLRHRKASSPHSSSPNVTGNTNRNNSTAR